MDPALDSVKDAIPIAIQLKESLLGLFVLVAFGLLLILHEKFIIQPRIKSAFKLAKALRKLPPESLDEIENGS